MGPTPGAFPGSRDPQGFQQPQSPRNIRGPSVLPSTPLSWSHPSSGSTGNADFPGSPSASGPPRPKVPRMSPQVSVASQVPPSDPGRQRKTRTLFTKEQYLALQELFDKCKYPSQEQLKALAQSLGVEECRVKIWFKNKRAKIRWKKGRELPGEPEDEPSEGPAQPNGRVPLVSSAGADAVCQSSGGVSSPPELSPLSHSPEQDSHVSTADQAFEDARSKQSSARKVRRRGKKSRELPGTQGHRSPSGPVLPKAGVPPAESASADLVPERPAAASTPLPGPCGTAPELESVSECPRSSGVSPAPQVCLSSNSPDHHSIFCLIDQACEELNMESGRAREQGQKAREVTGEQRKASDRPASSTSGTPVSAPGYQDSGSSSHSGVNSSPPPSPSRVPPDSGSIVSTEERPSGAKSPPPLSPSLFPHAESIQSADQTNESLQSEAPAARDGIPGRSAASELPAQEASAGALDSSMASPEAPEAPSNASGDPGEALSAMTVTEAEGEPGPHVISDELFLEELCRLDASLDSVFQPDFPESFSLLDYF